MMWRIPETEIDNVISLQPSGVVVRDLSLGINYLEPLYFAESQPDAARRLYHELRQHLLSARLYPLMSTVCVVDNPSVYCKMQVSHKQLEDVILSLQNMIQRIHTRIRTYRDAVQANIRYSERGLYPETANMLYYIQAASKRLITPAESALRAIRELQEGKRAQLSIQLDDSYGADIIGYLTRQESGSKSTKYQYKLQSIGRDTVDGRSYRAVRDASRIIDQEGSQCHVLTLVLTDPSVKTQSKQVDLDVLYPELSNDLNTLLELNRESAIRTPTRFNYASVISQGELFTHIKNRLMFLGHSEHDAATRITYACYPGVGVGTCEITKQIVPAHFIAQLRKRDGTTVSASVYYIMLHSTDGRVKYYGWRTDEASKIQVFHENNLDISEYWHAMVHAHNFTATKYLSPRALSTENVSVYTEGKVYRPVPYMGIELEVERAPDCAEDITLGVIDSLGRDYVTLVRDGSLRGYNPFEIVTAPATLAYHKTRLLPFLNNTSLKANLQSYVSGSCGMHVHISRDSFTGLHLAKFMRFINSRANLRFISAIAQRESNQYSRLFDVPLQECANNLQTSGTSAKYSAVNCRNSATIEVRIFRGNLSKVGVLKNLEFVHALWQYTMTAPMNELGYRDFLLWLFDTKNDTREYKYLKHWLVARKFLVSNIVIPRDSSEEDKIRRKEKRRKIQNIRAAMKRRYNLDKDYVKLDSNTPIPKENLLLSA